VEPKNRTHFDVLIIGAGPAGSACALSLRNSGLHVAIVDKHVFPREKICGDAIPGRAIKYLNQICPDFQQEFSKVAGKLLIRRSVIYFRGRKRELSWKLNAYTCHRQIFDHFLLSLVGNRTNTAIYQGAEVKEIYQATRGYDVVTLDECTQFSTTLLVGADGVSGITPGRLTPRQLPNADCAHAIRTCYKGIEDIDNDRTEIYLDKKYLPGYFWIFPLSGDLFNTGIGMSAETIAKKGINLKDAFHDFIHRSDILQKKLRNAVPVSSFKGCRIPYGFSRSIVSGDHFLLAGDAASLVDPLSGDGIGNAVLSGKLAAEQIIRSFASNDFSAGALHAYDRNLRSILGWEIKRSKILQKSLTKIPALLDLVFLLGN